VVTYTRGISSSPAALAISLKIVFSVGNAFASYHLFSCCSSTAFQIDMHLSFLFACVYLVSFFNEGELHIVSAVLIDNKFHTTIR